VFVLADDLASLPTQYGLISIGGRINMKFRALDAPDEVVAASAFNRFLEQLEQDNPYLTLVDQDQVIEPMLPGNVPPIEPDFLE